MASHRLELEVDGATTAGVCIYSIVLTTLESTLCKQCQPELGSVSYPIVLRSYRDKLLLTKSRRLDPNPAIHNPIQPPKTLAKTN